MVRASLMQHSPPSRRCVCVVVCVCCPVINLLCVFLCVCVSPLLLLTFQGGGAPTSFTQCPGLNVSVCAPTASLPFIALAYNPLPRHTDTMLVIPVASAGVAVTDAHGNPVQAQVVPTAIYDTSA